MDGQCSSRYFRKSFIRAVGLLAFGLLGALIRLSAADVYVGTAEAYSHGYMQGGLFNLDNYAKLDLSVRGGLKFAAKLSFGLETSNLNFVATPTSSIGLSELFARTLLFNGLEATAKTLLGLPVDLSYFLGQEDVFGSGSIFPDEFGTQIIASSFGGYTTYPYPSALLYDGIYQVYGNGLKLSFPSNPKNFVVDTYIYQDGYLGNGIYSADIRAALNLHAFKVATFVGGTVPQSSYGLYRAGLFLYYQPAKIGEFVAAVGLPHYLGGSSINVQDFYFLIEPRVYLDPLSVILTLFWHPSYYLESPTNEGGAVDVDMRLQLGNAEHNLVYGGLENLVAIRQSGTDQFTLALSPFVSVNTSGIIWDLKLTAKILPFAVDTLFQGYIGIRTEF